MTAKITRGSLIASNSKWHRRLGWLGGITLLVFGLSGLTHPLLSFTGPKVAKLMPPHAAMSAEQVRKIPAVLTTHNLEQAIVVKVVPSMDKPVLQVTQKNDEPRRYFDLESLEEISGRDEAQAKWLAGHYSGLKSESITNIRFQTSFDDEYPWVNRLLPVYRVEFDTPDSRAVYVYTEANAFAAITNDWRRNVQTVFRALHTWSWLNQFDNARVITISLMMIALMGMAITGIAMIFLMKSRKIKDSKRRWHRMMAYLIWLPIFALTASGFYHLLQMSYADNIRGLKLGDPISINASLFGENLQAINQALSGKRLSSVSIVKGPSEKLFYRITQAAPKPKKNVTRQMRFKGRPTTLPGEYFETETGERSDVSDQDMALTIAQRQLNLSPEDKVNMQRVTRFGPLYDFRNKRLPVWRIDYGTKDGDKVFIDPATGIVVDRLTNPTLYETLSFSILHKWNFLRPLMSNGWRHSLTVFIVGIACVAALLGMGLLGGRNRRRRRQKSTPNNVPLPAE